MADKNLHLYIVRHGEAEGNVDKNLYATKADHAIRLTERGIIQAQQAGAFLADHMAADKGNNAGEFGKIRLWHSPYYRAQETARHMLYPLGQVFDHNNEEITYRVNSFLFEQKAGLFDAQDKKDFALNHPKEAADYEKHSRFNGRSYAISPLGESRIETSFRTGPLFGKILRDVERQDIRQVIIVCHGVTAPAIAMNWMGYTPEWLDAEKTPGNCWIRHIHGNTRDGYHDEGYIYGENAPLRDPIATQRHLDGVESIYMLKPGRPKNIVPPGIQTIDPFSPP